MHLTSCTAQPSKGSGDWRRHLPTTAPACPVIHFLPTFAAVRTLLLDNYDSFTWNLQHLLVQLGPVDVLRNDAITVEEALQYDRIVLSPGPGLPADAGIMPALLATAPADKPVLGVCLGLQAMVLAEGGALFNQDQVRHGTPMECLIHQPTDALFAGLPERSTVGLYHSWAADPQRLPEVFRITATSAEGVIMGLRHRHKAWCAVQFHPESVLTPDGPRMVANWYASSS